MKLTLMLLMLGVLQVSANVYSQNGNINVQVSEMELSVFLWELKQNSDVVFVYKTSDLEGYEKISLERENASITDILDEVLSNTDLTYTFDNDVIVITKKQTQVHTSETTADQQQKKTITGKVTDEYGEPLLGASVVIKKADGSIESAAVTDENGVFTIEAELGDVMEFSYLGMKTQQVTFTGQTLTVIMEADVEDLGEVVLTGMFKRQAETFSGAASVITAEQLTTVGNQNVIQSLAMLDPSFQIITDLDIGSNPNALPQIQLRGQSGFPDLRGEYINDPNQPLFILDGFETTLDKVIDLDINLVESITLLQDATAKAIYGAEAANGVVVIEIKRPEKGNIRTTYTGTLDVSIADLTSYRLLNAADKLEAERLAGLYTADDGNARTQQTLTEEYNGILEDVLRGVDTDWLAQPVRNSVGSKHSLYLEGGDKYMLYGVDLAFQDKPGVMKGSYRKVISGGVTLTYRYKNLLFRNRLSVNYSESEDSPWGNFSEYARLNPYWTIYSDNGLLKEELDTGITNPMVNATINTVYASNYFDVTNNFSGQWRITPNLRFETRFGVTKRSTSADIFKPAGHTDFYFFTTEELIKQRGSYFDENGEYLLLNGDIGLDYTLIKDKHQLFVNSKANFQDTSFDIQSYLATGFQSDNMNHVSFAAQYAEGAPTGNEDISRNTGVVASMNYAYDNKYLLDLSYRLTGSSEFGANNRWGHFWAAGLGWNLHNTSFLGDVEEIDRLKLRSSIGYTGTQGFSSYQALSTYSYYRTNTYNGEVGAFLLGLANPDLQWQRTRDFNVGMDLNMFSNRLSLNFNYYVANTEGLLTDITVPQSLGFSTYKENLGETENKGFDIRMNYRFYLTPNNKRNSLSFFYNIGHNTNKVLKISDALRSFNEEQDAIKESEDQSIEQTDPSIRFEEGQSLSAIWGVRSLGIDPQTGQEVFLKKDGSTSYEWAAEDQVMIGDSRPEYQGNFGFNIEFEGLSFNANLNYRWGGQIYNSTLVSKVENADLNYNVDKRVFNARWINPGDMVKFKSIADNTFTRPTSRFVEDLNEINIASVSLAYDLKQISFIKKSKLQRVRLQLIMNNTATFSSVDIERGTSYPFARNFSLVLNTTF